MGNISTRRRSTLKIIFNGKRYLRDSRVTIAPYLLNRTKPPEDILNNLTSEDAARLDLIRAEHNMFIASGKAVPPSLSAGDYLELLCCPSVSARNRYYLFRFKVFQRREAKRLEQLSKATTKPTTELTQKNQILRMIRSHPIRAHQDDWVVAELRTADESAQTLVFDCSHENEMRLVDQKNLAKQLAMAFSRNREMRPFPFHFMFTSLSPGTNQYHFFEQAFGVHESMSKYKSLDDCPFTVKSEHFTKVVSGRRVVYLSPNAPRAFDSGEFDHDAVYVVGGIVDKAIRRPVTHAWARRSG
ncbi:unnamed protein product [Mesocestoides corti]|uniref:SAM-dependent MTase TRM10-type domain-containing protein n=1 Tax=Mesocestoides corti TaxID=53468 RepID=A0A0R3UQT4_MESCO|nr:unnamed protein product [Mesocestoides corti]